MRRNVVLSTCNRATCLHQTHGIMQEKHVTKRLISACDLSHVETLWHVCGRIHVRSHASPEKACRLVYYIIS